MDAEGRRRTRLRKVLADMGIDTSKIFDVSIQFPFGQPAVVTVSFFAEESIFEALTSDVVTKEEGK